MISVVIPWRTDNGPRAEAWAYLQTVWAKLPYELVVVEDDRPHEPFNRARLVNRGVARSNGEVVVMAGADHIPHPEAIEAAVTHLRNDHGWAPLYGSVGYLSQEDTRRYIAGEPLDQLPDEQVAGRAMGPIAVRRDVLDDIPMDERFSGWGYEDTAHRAALETLCGPASGSSHRLRCLWHPEGHRDMNGPNRDLYEREYVPAIGNPVAMREVINRGRPQRHDPRCDYPAAS